MFTFWEEDLDATKKNKIKDVVNVLIPGKIMEAQIRLPKISSISFFDHNLAVANLTSISLIFLGLPCFRATILCNVL